MLMGSHGENLTFSVDTSSFLSPEADVAFNCEYRQPCLWGLPNKNKTTGVISAFSSQRPSGVFQPGVLQFGTLNSPVSEPESQTPDHGRQLRNQLRSGGIQPGVLSPRPVSIPSLLTLNPGPQTMCIISACSSQLPSEVIQPGVLNLAPVNSLVPEP